MQTFPASAMPEALPRGRTHAEAQAVFAGARRSAGSARRSSWPRAHPALRPPDPFRGNKAGWRLPAPRACPRPWMVAVRSSPSQPGRGRHRRRLPAHAGHAGRAPRRRKGRGQPKSAWPCARPRDRGPRGGPEGRRMAGRALRQGGTASSGSLLGCREAHPPCLRARPQAAGRNHSPAPLGRLLWGVSAEPSPS